MNRSNVARICMAGAALWAAGSAAEAPSAQEILQLREQIEGLRQEQQAQIEQINRTNEQITAIEAAIARYQSAQPASATSRAPAPAAASAASEPHAPLSISGDFRLRYEGNSADDDGSRRHRGVLRARLKGQYDITDSLSVGARLVTGDADDPNSADATLSDFVDDLTVSLDQAYLHWRANDLDVYGGKMPNPFVRTELTWDGDVNPQGLSAAWRVPLAGAGPLTVTGGYFILQEQATGPDSDLRALQLAFSPAASGNLGYELAAAYYDYDIPTLAGADSGDLRTNLVLPGGTGYRSDFDLLDVVAAATLSPAALPWPLRIAGNYVTNLDAATEADSGFGLELLMGRASKAGDVRLAYGYSSAETDAVLAAFAQDNIPFGSNYRQHALSLDYLLASKALLNLSFYRYRLDDPADGAPGASRDWRSRVRLNFMMQL